MNNGNRFEREQMILKLAFQGYTRKEASIWYSRTKKDYVKFEHKYNKNQIRAAHKKGYQAKSIEKLDVLNTVGNKYISDLEYLSLTPINNDFSKWVEDIISTNKILEDLNQYSKHIYYEICRRNGRTLFFQFGKQNDVRIPVEEVIQLIKNVGLVELRPVYWSSKRKRIRIKYANGSFYANGNLRTEKVIRNTLNSITYNAVITRYDSLDWEFEDKHYRRYVKLYMANKPGESKGRMIHGNVNIMEDIENSVSQNNEQKSLHHVLGVNLKTGEYEFKGRTLKLENWEKVESVMEAISKKINLIYFYTVSLVVNENDFSIINISVNPYLPEDTYSTELNDFLISLLNQKKEFADKVNVKFRFNAIKKSRFKKYVEKNCRPGVRPYMQKLWYQAVWDDFLHNNKTTFAEKRWSWDKGFLSHRIEQYGLTEDNYTDFMSDYDYYWLNRINTTYLTWINDKTSFRYYLDKFRNFLPEYYYIIYSKKYSRVISKLIDADDSMDESIEGILTLLKAKDKLVMKPSSGTHGDGFYCLEYCDDNNLYINGDKKSHHNFKKLIDSLKSFYVITNYINNGSFFKNIYPDSLNTVRIMLVNKWGFNPKIMQSYIRIGSKKTGFTDNVAFGGICAMIDIDTGEIYQPERLIDHKYVPCPTHPDTGTVIGGHIPDWKNMCDKVCEIARNIPELEYLGFDIAFTETGFKIIEINIHQDLHKYAEMSEEAKDFFDKKIMIKKAIYDIN